VIGTHETEGTPPRSAKTTCHIICHGLCLFSPRADPPRRPPAAPLPVPISHYLTPWRTRGPRARRGRFGGHHEAIEVAGPKPPPSGADPTFAPINQPEVTGLPQCLRTVRLQHSARSASVAWLGQHRPPAPRNVCSVSRTSRCARVRLPARYSCQMRVVYGVGIGRLFLGYAEALEGYGSLARDGDLRWALGTAWPVERCAGRRRIQDLCQWERC